MSPLPRRPRLADHALARRHLAGGEPRVVLHDTRKGGLIALGPREWTLFSCADGTRDLDGIVAAAARAGAHARAPALGAFLEQLHGAGLLADGTAGVDAPAPGRAPRARRVRGRAPPRRVARRGLLPPRRDPRPPPRRRRPARRRAPRPRSAPRDRPRDHPLGRPGQRAPPRPRRGDDARPRPRRLRPRPPSPLMTAPRRGRLLGELGPRFRPDHGLKRCMISSPSLRPSSR